MAAVQCEASWGRGDGGFAAASCSGWGIAQAHQDAHRRPQSVVRLNDARHIQFVAPRSHEVAIADQRRTAQPV